MINKKLLVLFIIAFACSLNFSFAYPKLSEADHKFIDTMLNRYHSISKDLKKKGMKFVGSITIYSYLEAIGIIDNHTKDCFKY